MRSAIGLAAFVTLAASSCVFNGAEPAVYNCSAAHPECPPGLTCVANRCVKSSQLDGGSGAEQRFDLSPVNDRRPLDTVQRPDAPATCGNGKRDPNEECEGGDLGGATCRSLAAGNGPLGCTPWCSFDVSKCCTAPNPPLSNPPTAIVSVTSGDDELAIKVGSHCVAFKTITAALAKGWPPGSTIWVAPGVYTGPLENFPITVKDVQLLGDPATKGEGSTTNGPTQIAGSGGAPTGMDPCTFTIAPGMGQLLGFRIESGPGYGVCTEDGSSTITDNTYTGARGIKVQGFSGCPNIANSTLSVVDIGIFTACPKTMIQNNTFNAGNVMIEVVSGSPSIEANSFSGLNLSTIQVEGKGTSPAIMKNIFDTSSQNAALFFQNGAAGTVRGNQLSSGTKIGNAVLIYDTATPDFGMILDPGANDFGVGPFIHKGTSTIFAFGNQWGTNPPSCAQIMANNGGKVIWGGGPNDYCPTITTM